MLPHYYRIRGDNVCKMVSPVPDSSAMYMSSFVPLQEWRIHLSPTTLNLVRQNVSLVVIFQVIFLSADMPIAICFFFFSWEVLNCGWDRCFSGINSLWVSTLAYTKHVVPLKFHFSIDICAIYLLYWKKKTEKLMKRPKCSDRYTQVLRCGLSKNPQAF